ncbi:MAG: hypothetical protein BroJett003_13100 [Planctomycetota bacterium]|nr:MAG: hypothetical protein BroJett003_13100 [Planctomycetota bacterium]
MRLMNVNPVGRTFVAVFLLALVGSEGCAPTGGVDDSAGSTSARDIDGDGVANDADLCPSTPAGEAVDAGGCALSQLDSDQDGVSNAADACADTPAGLEVDADGCTRVFAWRSEADPFVSPLLALVPVTYEMTSAGEFQQARYELDGLVALLNLLGGLGDFGGGDGGDTGDGGGSSFLIEAEVAADTAVLGAAQTLVRADFEGGDLGLSGALGIIVELTAFDVAFADGAVTWTFDVSVEMNVSGLLVISDARYTGTATGVLSEDGSTITWTSITGTLTASGGVDGGEESIPLEEVFVPDESNPDGGVLPAWTLEE